MKTHDVTQQAKGLKGRPGVWMDLGGSHIERPKDTHCKFVKRERYMQVCKKTSVHIEKKGIDTCPPQTYALGRPARYNTKEA